MVWPSDYTLDFTWIDERPCGHLSNVASSYYTTSATCVVSYQDIIPTMDKLCLRTGEFREGGMDSFRPSAKIYETWEEKLCQAREGLSAGLRIASVSPFSPSYLSTLF